MGSVAIAGIGASAGGLEAITQLISHLKPDLPCAYVVLQHLSPSYRSMMVEILGRETPLHVKEMEQGDVPEAGVIYVVPANSNALIREGCFCLMTAAPEVVPKPSINQFLISLAAEEGDAAIGIVLSGTGSDGVAGLRAIQAAGGFTLAQRPDSAKYDGMPRAAIEAGVVDHVLTPEEIAAQIPRLLELPPAGSEVEPPPDLLQNLLVSLRDRLQFDFSGYKVGTLMRRIRRRQFATGGEDLAAYLRWVERHPEELELLARDILISVTAFFRDREAFAALRRVVGDIVARKASGSEIRVWVAGCATGEEAYSIAMLFADALGDKQEQYRVQIFATDVDDEALNVARRGVYPAASMSEVGPEQLDRYFKQIGNTYEAGKVLRDMIVFARHNLVSDPPFMRLDLVSCRNVLIYFDAPLQSKVLKIFHFGLAAEAYLFLGRSESIAQAEQHFSTIDRRERLFRKQGDSMPIIPTSSSLPVSSLRTTVQRRDRRLELLLSGLVSHFGLTVAICDREGNVLHTAGEVDKLMHFPVGASRLLLGDVVLPDLRGEVLTLLRRCQQQNSTQKGRRRRLGHDYLRIIVEPVSDGSGELLLVIFAPEAVKEVAAEEIQPSATQQLEDELLTTREHLQALVEEMATANEEMQALNEESQAANEELQATNEELEAANEEMQATNEELVSLNEELNVKTIELSRLSEDYAHLYDALEYPVLVFDRSLQLSRFNAPAARRFDLRSTALRQHLSRLRLPEALGEMETWLGRALAHGDREQILVQVDKRDLRVLISPGLGKTGSISSLVVSFIDVSDIVRTQAALSQSEERLNALMENTTVIFAMRDVSGNYIYANRRFIEFFGLEDKEVLGKNDFSLFEHELAVNLWNSTVSSLRSLDAVTVEYEINDARGTRYLRAVHQSLYDPGGNPVALILEAEDVSASKLAEQQLRITARVFDQAGEAIVVTDPLGVIQTTNKAFSAITGYGIEESVGKQVGRLLKSGRHSADFYAAMWGALRDKGFWQGEIWNKRKSGEVFPEWLTINRVDDADGRVEHFVSVFSDITDIKNAQRKAEYLAAHDVLTGLPNRTLFQDRLRHALAQARRKQERLALMFIDLDNFKDINDTLGHDIGDELLRQAANRLQQVMRDVDTVARLGGDEFTAVLSDCDAEGAGRISRRIVDELAASFDIQGRQLFVSASVGVAFFPEDGQDSNALVKAADTAMYRAKELGRNRVEFFVPDLHVRLLKRATMESAMRAALDLGRLRLVYQPKFSLQAGHPLVGAEALLRWRDPELGDVSPGEFIPVCEACGLIKDVTRMVQKLLLSQIATWLKLGLKVPPIAFNCSPRNVREADMAESLVLALQDSGVPAGLVQVEITEGALLENSEAVIGNLNQLHHNGVAISVDDFGTGYSSLTYLKRLPLAELKVDKSFVDGLGSDTDDEAIARAVLGLAQALGLRSVAEGVENERQMQWLSSHGCEVVQGYHLSRPLETVDFEDLLARVEGG
ncbi:EAL domain-containing protein [Azonexus hydrophilus]|uniref:EAL domain-containing protein n=1 Tax=Azonexus hydrophilus TaxID=418702 RepID=A0ABZ2XNI5_9RHOO